MMWLGWLGAALIVILLIAVVVAAVRLLLPAAAGATGARACLRLSHPASIFFP